MDDLGRRIGDALADLPGGAPPARETTVRRAQELAGARRPRRRRRLVVVLGAAAAALGTGVALAGTGAIDVPVVAPGPSRGAPPAPARPLTLPPGAHGIAVVAGGRLHLRTRSGVGIDGLPAVTADLSPNALYVAVGLRRGLAALSPAGRTAWARPTPGPVVEASWSPYPVWIAYVVREGARRDLRVIEGDGDHDRLVARGVDQGRPGWSPDGAVVRFRRGGRWFAHTPATGTTRATAGPAAGAGPARDVVAVEQGPAGARRLEVWWAPPGGGARRLLMRAPAAAGPVRVSVG